MKKKYKILFIALLIVSFLLILTGVLYYVFYLDSSEKDSHDDSTKNTESFEEYLTHCGVKVYENNQHLNYINEEGKYFISLDVLNKKFDCDISSYKSRWSHCDLNKSGILLGNNENSFDFTIVMGGCITPEK